MNSQVSLDIAKGQEYLAQSGQTALVLLVQSVPYNYDAISALISEIVHYFRFWHFVG